MRKILRPSPEKKRCDHIQVAPETVERLYNECDGYVQRVLERLNEEGIKIGYSTLTRMVRELGLGEEDSSRCDQVEDVPGAEMQHDTSPYRLKIGHEMVAIIASLIYLRFSKKRYLKFYRAFNRFSMKCFFHESLTYWGHSAPICVIDNTNLAVLHGTGKNAVFVPEMVEFAKPFRFSWLAHEKGHSDRKAGEERGFWTVETNFFPGRTFQSLEDLNAQAMHWATEIMAKRPLTKARIIPNEYFEKEKPSLQQLPPYVPEPYLDHERGVDQYGYAALDGNYYWVPGTGRGDVKILEYANRIRIYRNRELLTEYPLPPYGTKNKKYRPPGVTAVRSKKVALPSDIEEGKLRSLAKEVSTYLDFALAHKSVLGSRARFIRELYRLHTRMALSLFIHTIERATTYGVTDLRAVERIAVFLLRDELFDAAFPESPAKFQNRDIYREGRLSADPDLSVYQRLLDDAPNPEDDHGDL